MTFERYTSSDAYGGKLLTGEREIKISDDFSKNHLISFKKTEDFRFIDKDGKAYTEDTYQEMDLTESDFLEELGRTSLLVKGNIVAGQTLDVDGWPKAKILDDKMGSGELSTIDSGTGRYSFIEYQYDNGKGHNTVYFLVNNDTKVYDSQNTQENQTPTEAGKTDTTGKSVGGTTSNTQSAKQSKFPTKRVLLYSSVALLVFGIILFIRRKKR